MDTCSTKRPEQWLEEFHHATGVLPLIEEDAFGRMRSLDLRMRLMAEEFHEAMDELLDARNGKGDLQKIAKELADLCVIAIGTCDLMEIPFTQVFAEVMRSNLSKIRPDGTVVLRPDGKVLKPDSYLPADLSFLVS
jgi:NTP pyrophosphatase (non-canonical NTP hydrolase)